MKTRTLVSILILVLAVLIITGGCDTTPEIKEKRGGINQVTFFQAVKDGDVAEVKSLIEAGADVNAQNKEGVTALMTASATGHTDIAKLLIEEGADVTIQSKE